MLDFPLPRGVIKRVPDPESDAVGVFPQFARQGRGLRSVIPGPAKAGSAGGSSSAAAKASKQSPPLPPAPGLVTAHRQSPIPSIVSGCVKSGSTPARTSELFPEPLAPTTSTNGRCALTCASKASNTSPDRSCSTVEDGRVFEIEEIQPAERAGFPPAYFPAQEFLAGLLVYLTRQKIAEMFPEELFKLLQVAIVVERPGEVPLAVRSPNAQRTPGRSPIA